MTADGAEVPEGIVPIVMPKWGLSMTEGEIVEWLIDEGETVERGQEIVDVETDKISGSAESPGAGVVRRIVATAGQTHPVGALLAVLAEESVDDATIADFVDSFVVPEVAGGEAAESPYRMAEVDGVGVRYSRLGEGRPIVLIHGFGGDLDNWLFNLDALAEHGEVIALDLPGHGGSDLTVDDPSVDGMARFVGRFLDAVGVDEPAVVVGHSMGGAVAARLAGTAPDRVASVVLVAPAGLGATINQGYLDGFVDSRTKRQMKAVVPDLFADQGQVGPRLIEGLLRYKRLDGVIPLLARIRDAWFDGGQQKVDVTGDLESRPAAVIWGADDRIIGADQAAGAKDRATVTVIPDAGHMVQMEKPREVNEAIIAHLRR